VSYQGYAFATVEGDSAHVDFDLEDLVLVVLAAPLDVVFQEIVQLHLSSLECFLASLGFTVGGACLLA